MVLGAFFSPVVENSRGALCVPKRAPLAAPNSGMRHSGEGGGGGGGGGGRGGGPRRHAGRELHFEAVLSVDCSPCRHAHVLWRPCQCHVKPEKKGWGEFGGRGGEKGRESAASEVYETPRARARARSLSHTHTLSQTHAHTHTAVAKLDTNRRIKKLEGRITPTHTHARNSYYGNTLHTKKKYDTKKKHEPLYLKEQRVGICLENLVFRRAT